MGGSLAEVEWEGILHWKTWALASLDCCISTTKCAVSETCTNGFAIAVSVAAAVRYIMAQRW